MVTLVLNEVFESLNISGYHDKHEKGGIIMIRRFKVLRVGGLNFGSARFLDFLASDLVEKLVLIDYEGKDNLFQEIFDTARFFGKENLLNKLSIRKLKEPKKKSLFRYARVALYRMQNYILPPRRAVKILFSELDEVVQMLLKAEPKFDILWIGDNDFDGSNLIFYYLHRILKGKAQFRFIRSYKETRFTHRIIERYMLTNCDRYIFPNEAYLDFFGRLYSIDLKNLSAFADLDWRYSGTVDWVKNLRVEKLSANDGKPHVCILAGAAYSEPLDKHTGPRYYYLPVIQELVKRKVYVHLHALRIIPSRDNRNAYAELAKCTNYFRIEKPLKLYAGSKDYEVLKRYDVGLLHVPVPKEATPLYEFQKINIPNRLYELQMCDVVPVVEEGVLPATEQIITRTNFGIIYKDYDDLSEKLFELVKGNVKNFIEREKINDFSDFTRIFVETVTKLL